MISYSIDQFFFSIIKNKLIRKKNSKAYNAKVSMKKLKKKKKKLSSSKAFEIPLRIYGLASSFKTVNHDTDYDALYKSLLFYTTQSEFSTLEI